MNQNRDKMIRSMIPVCGFKRIYRLRWKFHFVDGTVKTGIWNGASNNFNDQAASINKANLILAQIQTEDFYGYTIQTVFECDGHDYVTSRWVGVGSANINRMISSSSNVTNITPTIVGLLFQTRQETISVFVDGSVSRRVNPTNAKIENIREHKTKV